MRPPGQLFRRALTASCSLTLASCEVKTVFVPMIPGSPGEVVAPASVLIRRLGDEQVGEQRIGGWIVMPPEHFAALKRAAEGNSR